MWEPAGIGPPMPETIEQIGRPRLPPGLIWRDRLAKALDAGTRRAVTLVCAGPGWGKTTAVTTWAAARSINGPIAWLTLDPGHNDPYVFWSDLLLALQTSGAVRPGDRIPGRGATLATDGVAFLRRLGSGLGASAGPVVVVLDDLHEITEPRVLDALAGLLRRVPERLRLVLVARSVPELQLHRLRAAGDLVEIRAHDLAFRVEEAAELMALRGVRAPVDQVAAQVRATEGWAAGLRLALDAPAGAVVDEAAGDYLIREVLATQPPELREFLLSTSVPDRISGDLATALTGRRHAEQILDRLAHANLFLERVGTTGWFRYHRQFRAALRYRLARIRPEVVPRLHLLAAQWHARHGTPLAALTHATLAGDWDLVGRLVVDHGLPLFASPDRAELIGLLRQVPVDRLPGSAELMFCAALRSYALGDMDGLSQRLTQSRVLLTGRGRASRQAIELAVNAMEAATVINRRGEMRRLVTVTTEVLAELGRLRWDQTPSMPQHRAIALLSKGIGLLWTDRADHADRYLWAAATGSRAAGTPLVEISALGHLALLGVLHGSLRTAGEHAAAALGVARRIEAEDRAATAPAHLVQAAIELLRGGGAEAEDGLRRALHACGDQPEAAMTVLSGTLRAYLLVERGEPGTAGAVLGGVVQEAGPGLDAPLLRRIIGLARSEIDLALNTPAPVLARYGTRDGLYPAEQVLLAQACQATGRHDAAEQLFYLVREGPDRVSAVTAWLLTALDADAHGHSARASEALGRALAKAEPERIRRPFRRYGGDRVLALAERQQWLTETRDPSGDAVLAEITGEIPAIVGVPSAGPLSEREIDVLQYLPTVLTAGEIAENLGISVNTVKAHMRSIYRKLGAGRRRAAVVIARQLGLL
ncbi:LuxR C-terminal-related transcriptional regulator [Actinoplanes regularis]|uniref:LuxR family transcriptional regulator, maltose regulon positive regulatory protein n=1 Tax=Actinoplanes regularis TaxID=52697 RepID=A0A239HYK3_9ACTN|nr:LuxR C-terminal-related transcriptional regulator [Actinoplanes regularis]GIE91237.1 LuxR family transcriptional regulator [Actinoplanes regularis]SNS85304.1 LuxR family transcriptional regulator, maltose regulon positive regulatory protein [Actinoplanes regularis]